MPGCFALSCPKNFSAQSDPVLFCASDNKIFELELFVTVQGGGPKRRKRGRQDSKKNLFYLLKLGKGWVLTGTL